MPFHYLQSCALYFTLETKLSHFVLPAGLLNKYIRVPKHACNGVRVCMVYIGLTRDIYWSKM